MSGFTPGPWSVWDGPDYVGGGADLCIGAGENWLANMNHRQPRCPQIMEDGHPDNESCDICSLDADDITGEQRANAHLIAAAPDLYEAARHVLALLDHETRSVTALDADKLRKAIAKAGGHDDFR